MNCFEILTFYLLGVIIYAMKFKKKIMLRQVAGQNLLIPIGEAVNSVHGIYLLSETAAVIYKALVDGDENDAVNAILDEYDVSADVALTDVREFIGTMREQGLV